ncbi:MAG: heavy metal-responsive transcriptional regulator [Chloroflexi bacterium]|nr:heavy metal-responsive transcriptional regulator [Chloroflexota bacterium]
MKIGELARATGFTPKTIRYYEGESLLPDPGRTDSGYRVYDRADVERLEFIRKAKRLGLSLEEIKSILRLHDRREPTCTHVRVLLETKLGQVDALLQDLREFREELCRLRDRAGDLADCGPTGGRICGIIEASGPGIGAGVLAWVRGGAKTHGKYGPKSE